MNDPDLTSGVSLSTTTEEILLAASRHELSALKPLLRVPGAASAQDPETGMTPLHAAIGAFEDEDPETITEEDIEKAKETVRELFLAGAIWNDVDKVKDETPGCLARRVGRMELYELVIEAGVRAEVLLNLLGGSGYEVLSSGDEEEEDEEMEEGGDEPAANANADEEEQQKQDEQAQDINGTTASSHTTHPIASTTTDDEVTSAAYLSTPLTFTPTTLLDSSTNGVMMSWESSIMSRTATLLAPVPGLRILNIGFGMGIIDSLFAATKPSKHHIIEAHPDVLSHMRSESASFSTDGKPSTEPRYRFDEAWEASGEERGSNKILAGRWQDVVPSLVEAGEMYDVIYFDTFAEDYSQLKLFFSEYVIALLSPEGKFSFFNGLGADRQVCYDVYCRVVELDLTDAGLDVEWDDVDVDLEGLEMEKEGVGEWSGVKRRYWTLGRYRLPVCGFLG